MHGRGLRRRPRARRRPGRRTRVPLHPLRERNAPRRGRRHEQARGRSRTSPTGGPDRADRRRERGGRRVRRGGGLRPDLRVVGVQSGPGPGRVPVVAGGRAWSRTGWGPTPRASRPATAFEFPQRILRERLDEFVLVDDDEIRRGERLMMERTRNLVEAAGAAALAAALQLDLAGQEGRPDRERREHDARPTPRAARLDASPARLGSARGARLSHAPRPDRRDARRATAERSGPTSGCSLLVKLEYLNPGGSNKDRIGLRMLEVAERGGEAQNPAARSSSRPQATRASASRSPRSSRGTR